MNKWIIKQSIEFQDWFSKLDDVLQESIVEHVKLLEVFGPSLKRPYADTLKRSQLVNLKYCGDKKFYLKMIKVRIKK